MSIIELSKNRSVVVVLFGAYVAVEGYFLSLIANYAVGRFWLSNVIVQIASVMAAYLIMDAIFKQSKMPRRKKIIVAIVVLLGTFIFAIAFATLKLYLVKLHLQATFN